MMKNLLPDRVELALLAAMALVCTLIVSHRPAMDLWMAMLTVPLFVVSAVMGLRRNWRETEADQDDGLIAVPERCKVPSAEHATSPHTTTDR